MLSYTLTAITGDEASCPFSTQNTSREREFLPGADLQAGLELSVVMNIVGDPVPLLSPYGFLSLVKMVVNNFNNYFLCHDDGTQYFTHYFERC